MRIRIFGREKQIKRHHLKKKKKVFNSLVFDGFIGQYMRINFSFDQYI